MMLNVDQRHVAEITLREYLADKPKLRKHMQKMLLNVRFATTLSLGDLWAVMDKFDVAEHVAVTTADLLNISAADIKPV